MLLLAPALDILVSVAAESRSEDPNVTIAGDCVTCQLCDRDIVPRDTTSLHSSQSQLVAELEMVSEPVMDPIDWSVLYIVCIFGYG